MNGLFLYTTVLVKCTVCFTIGTKFYSALRMRKSVSLRTSYTRKYVSLCVCVDVFM
jgi:hypothetical protein